VAEIVAEVAAEVRSEAERIVEIRVGEWALGGEGAARRRRPTEAGSPVRTQAK